MAKSASPSYERPDENVAKKKTLPATKARAGLKDTNTMYVMIISTVLVIVFFGAFFLIYGRGP
jgi:hypothetical protein